MQVSVVIVNYNVRHFLEQCLYSVEAAFSGLQGEIIVVDNDSQDKSIEYLRPGFPRVTFLQNAQNVGFARACNQGFAVSRGKYVLFLNPDTIVPEDCFKKCIGFFEANPDAGALGCRMLDGRGRFLPESKRAFPSPLTSLYKLFGFAKVFPRSKTFSRYHLGHLPADRDNEVDVLAGAFFMTKRDVLEKVGSFDEAFFMYGEDVDLSYRIQKGGWKNYYFSGISILHFKGESTRKGSMNYVRLFYKAMSTFVRKHYGGSRAGIFNLMIHFAIWFRAGFTAFAQFIRKAGLPLLDAGLILLSFWIVKEAWIRYVRPDIHYERSLLWIAFPAFTIFYLTAAFFAGLYDRWYRRSELIRSTLIATLVLLAAYALLPEQYRFSRGIILFGSLLAFVMISVLRFFLVRGGVLSKTGNTGEVENTVIAGTASEYEEVLRLLTSVSTQQKILGRLKVGADDAPALGHVNAIASVSSVMPVREVIFCRGQLTYSEIIAIVSKMPRGVRARIHSAGSLSIVGSDSKDQSGQTVSSENGFHLSDPYRRRLKRLLDIAVSFGSILIFPVHFFLVKKPFSFIGNCFRVLFASRSWIGYASAGKNLPRLRKGIIACNGVPSSQVQKFPQESLDMMDYWYARDYEPSLDFRLIRRSYRHLGD